MTSDTVLHHTWTMPDAAIDRSKSMAELEHASVHTSFETSPTAPKQTDTTLAPRFYYCRCGAGHLCRQNISKVMQARLQRQGFAPPHLANFRPVRSSRVVETHAKEADGPRLAIVGITGAVGQEFLRVRCLTGLCMSHHPKTQAKLTVNYRMFTMVSVWPMDWGTGGWLSLDLVAVPPVPHILNTFRLLIHAPT